MNPETTEFQTNTICRLINSTHDSNIPDMESMHVLLHCPEESSRPHFLLPTSIFLCPDSKSRLPPLACSRPPQSRHELQTAECFHPVCQINYTEFDTGRKNFSQQETKVSHLPLQTTSQSIFIT